MPFGSFDFNFDFVGSIDFDVSNFDITEVTSVATDTGAELLSSVQATSVFDYNLTAEEVASFGTWQQAGSLAGNADYFDYFYSGDMVDSAKAASSTAGYGDSVSRSLGGGVPVVDRVGVPVSELIPVDPYGPLLTPEEFLKLANVPPLVWPNPHSLWANNLHKLPHRFKLILQDFSKDHKN
jgi:hypothetical protein